VYFVYIIILSNYP